VARVKKPTESAASVPAAPNRGDFWHGVGQNFLGGVFATVLGGILVAMWGKHWVEGQVSTVSAQVQVVHSDVVAVQGHVDAVNQSIGALAQSMHVKAKAAQALQQGDYSTATMTQQSQATGNGTVVGPITQVQSGGLVNISQTVGSVNLSQDENVERGRQTIKVVLERYVRELVSLKQDMMSEIALDKNRELKDPPAPFGTEGESTILLFPKALESFGPEKEAEVFDFLSALKSINANIALRNQFLNGSYVHGPEVARGYDQRIVEAVDNLLGMKVLDGL
jgi:hypothetical protein